MVFKQIVGIIQIIFSLVFLIGMVLGLTVVKSRINDNILAGADRIPAELAGSLDFTLLLTLSNWVSIFFGVLGVLFLLQGIINLKGEGSKQISFERGV